MDMRDHEPVLEDELFEGNQAFADTFADVLAPFFGVNHPLFKGSKLFINFEFLLAFIYLYVQNFATPPEHLPLAN
jgi:hypothetical protein